MDNKPKAHSARHYVYVLFRDTGEPFYIGKGYGRRWMHHAVDARAGKRGYRFNIIRDMQAHGVEMAMVKIHEGLTEDVAHKYEIALIAAIGRYPNGPLANLTDGGEGLSGFKPSPETLAKLSASHRGKVFSPETKAKLRAANLGKKLSAEHIAKLSTTKRGDKAVIEHLARLSASNLGRIVSLETRAKLSASGRGQKKPPGWGAKISARQRGISRSPETRAKLRVANLGKKQSPETRAKKSAAMRKRAMGVTA